MAAAEIAVSPAAGPLTLMDELLIMGMTIPPMTPAISPEKTDTPEASEIPRHNGNVTKNTVMLAFKSYRKTDFTWVTESNKGFKTLSK